MSDSIDQQMDPKQIYALPQHINQHGELVIHTRDFAQLMGMTPKEVEIVRIRLLYGLFLYPNDTNIFAPETIPLKEALLIANEIE